MNEYLISIKIISNVISGKNLNDEFNRQVSNNKEILNVAKIKDLCNGVIRYYTRFSIILNNLVNKSIKNKKIGILLLISIYELNYTKKQDYFIVSYIVDISYKIAKEDKIKSFVNAVLRNYLRNKNDFNSKYEKNLEFKYSIQKWWIDKLKRNYPEQFEAILDKSNNIPKICLRVDKNKIIFEEYLEVLQFKKIEYNLIDGKIVLQSKILINEIPYFKDGFISIQNISAQKLVEFICFKDNMNILDACCAPGGKMCQILENFSVTMTGIDINADRLLKVRENLNRICKQANLILGDATQDDWWDKNYYDMIIADVPCSASGTIKKNPDIKINRRFTDIIKFVNLQRNIVGNLLNMLQIGGRMLYVTCSIFPEENEENILYLKNKHKNIKIIKELKIIPDEYWDGFYYCLLEKTA